MVQNTVDINHTNTSVIRYSASRPKVSKYSLQSSSLMPAIMMNDYNMTKLLTFCRRIVLYIVWTIFFIRTCRCSFSVLGLDCTSTSRPLL